MKALRLIVFLCGLLVILSACGPQASPTVQSKSPLSPNTNNASSPTETLVPVNLAGPEMKVGSTFLYVDGSVLVAVPAGIFSMGHGGVDNPEHKVNLTDFWIYRTKVTNGQYAYCVASGACTPLISQSDNPTFNDPLHASDPMVGVDYNQAEAYCSFVNARLPTEAEWEKTARGPDANIYPWGNGAPSCDLLNYETCVGNTTPVNKYPNGRSFYSAFDMEGNTFEWVADWYKADYYGIGPDDDPKGPDTGTERSVRSSAFNSGQNQTQAFNRFFTRPEDHRNNLGFRCVVVDPLYFAPFCQYPAVFGTDGVGGGPTGETITVSCPNLSINQTPGCNNLKPSTGVTFNGPSGALITVPQPPCQQDPNNPNKYTCTGDGKLSICSECTVTVTSQPQCPNGYTYDATSKSCVSAGGPGQCLPGFVLGPNVYRAPVLSGVTPVPGAQCCSLQTSNGANPTNGGRLSFGGTFPSCPAGTYFDGMECISVQVQSPFCKSAGVALVNSCNPNGGVCKLTAASCGPPRCKYGGTFNADKCSCDCNAG
jgi:sulfatase modifying factor 1